MRYRLRPQPVMGWRMVIEWWWWPAPTLSYSLQSLATQLIFPECEIALCVHTQAVTSPCRLDRSHAALWSLGLLHLLHV